MSNFFHEYPYSNFHELNLDWILEKINEFDATLTSWTTLAEELETQLGNITQMQSDIAALQSATADLNSIRNDIQGLKDEDSSLQNQITSIFLLFDGIDNRFQILDNKIQTKYNQLLANHSADLVAVYQNMGELKADLQFQITSLYESFEYVLSHLSSDVYNPIWGSRYTFDENNEKIYSDLNYGTLTVAEYQYQDLTVLEYAALNLSAVRYYLYGRFDIAKAHWTVGPISGVRKTVANALTEIVNFFAGTLTAAEFALLGLDVYDFDALNLTVKDYFYYNNNGLGLTSSQYDAINKLNSGILRI